MSRRARGCSVGSDIGEWQAEHRDGVACGPSVMVSCGRFRFYDALGPMRDESVVADSIRLTRKGGLAVVASSGKLPFGSTPSVKHQHSYAGSRLYCTTDWHFPRDTVIREHFSLGNCELPTAPVRWRALAGTPEAVTAGTWEPWPATAVNLPDEVVAVTLDYGAEGMIEIGMGSDLWRWHGWTERPPGGCWQLGGPGRPELRRVIAAADNLTPKPRTWRFSWYACWAGATAAAMAIPDGKRAVWWSDGSLDTGYLKRAAVIELDLSGMAVPQELCRDGGSQVCLTARGTQRRLRHAVRQIRELTAADVPVVFSGWNPGACTVGSHVDRKGERRHWDWPNACDLFSWTRNALGPERPLHLRLESPLQTHDVFDLLDLAEEPLTIDELFA